MTTITLTKARANLGKLCERAKRGEEIGIIAGDQILQLSPVEVKPAVPGEIAIVPMTRESVTKEYGVTAAEWKEFQKRERVRYIRSKRAGRIVAFKGEFDPSVLD